MKKLFLLSILAILQLQAEHTDQEMIDFVVQRILDHQESLDSPIEGFNMDRTMGKLDAYGEMYYYLKYNFVE